MADTAKFFILDLDQSPVPEGSLRDPAYRRRLRDTQHERWRTATPGEARVITRMLRQRKQDPNAGQRPQAASPRARERRDGSKRNHSRGSPSDDPDLSDPAPRTCLYGPCGVSLAGRRAGAKYCSEGCKTAAHRGKTTAVTRRAVDLYHVFGLAPDGSDIRERLAEYAERCHCGHPLIDPEWGDCIKCGHGRAGDRIAAIRPYIPTVTAFHVHSHSLSPPWNGEKTGKQPRELVAA